MPSNLLAALKLPPPKVWAQKAAASSATAKPAANGKTAAAKTETATAAASKPAATPSPAQAEFGTALNEAARYAMSLADDDTKRELGLALKEAEKARTDAQKLGDQNARDAAVKKATESIKKARVAVEAKVRSRLGMAAAKDKPEEVKDGKPKLAGKVITDKGKLGLGAGVDSAYEKKNDKGDVVKCNAAFEGSAWVESKPVPYAQPPEFELTFHLVLGAKASAGAKRDRDSGASAGINVEASIEYELVRKRKATDDEARRYLDAIKAGKAAGWEELKALELAVKGSMNEAKALAKQLGATAREMKDDEETEETLSATAGGDADVSAKKGAFGIGLSLGGSVSGSLSRKIAFKDGQYWITLQSASAKSVKGGAGFSVEGVGMNASGNKEAHESRAITFVIDPKKPELKPLLQQVMAAKTIAQMLDLRAKNAGVASFDVDSSGGSEGGGVGVSLFGVGMSGTNQTFGSATKIDGPDGTTRIYTGGNTTGAAAKVGDKTVGGSSRTDAFTGGAGADNKGFGETTATDKSGDLMAGLGALADKMKQSPLTTAKNIVGGKEEFSKDTSRQQGAAFTDESYGQLAARAKGSAGQWGKYWRGDIKSYMDWMKTQGQVKACGDDRQKIAAVIAGFERASGRGRHETVRNAIAGTEVAFEFPPPLLSKKSYYDTLVVNDPLPAALGAGAPADVLKKLEELLRQLDGFRNDMSKAQTEFVRPEDYQDMSERLDQRRAQLLPAIKTAKAKVKAADDEAKGVNQFTPPEVLVSKVDPEKERERQEALASAVEALKRKVGDAYADEQRIFAAWETDLKGVVLLGVKWSNPDLMTLFAHQDKLKKLYPVWDKRREELRKALTDAGAGYDAREADALQPDRARYRKLRAEGPWAGMNVPDGV